jgi:hypothetical protein
MKKLIIIIALIPMMAKAQFIKDDKLKHKLVSHAIVHVGGYAMYKATNRAGLSIFTSIITSLAIGYGKEKFYDKEFSNDDMGANINGILVGAICLAVTINLNQIKIDKKEQQLRLY